MCVEAYDHPYTHWVNTTIAGELDAVSSEHYNAINRAEGCEAHSFELGHWWHVATDTGSQMNMLEDLLRLKKQPFRTCPHDEIMNPQFEDVMPSF
jgi:hypothetical protein